jgi:hypothetical protein
MQHCPFNQQASKGLLGEQKGKYLMNQKFERIEKHLYRRQYQTASGELSTIYYAEFTDWQGIRRKFPLGDELSDARDKPGELRNLNKAAMIGTPRKRKPRKKSAAPSYSLNGETNI